MNDAMICQHHISDVALHRFESSYLVECDGCGTALGVVSDPREFQALRRRVVAAEQRTHHEADRP